MSDEKARFGDFKLAQISSAAENSIPINTVKSKLSVWMQFSQFCRNRNYILEQNTSLNKLNEILADWAFNMRKTNGDDYKESVIKTMWNNTTKQVQEYYFKKWNIIFDPFKDIIFESSRKARDAKRRILQGIIEKRRESSAPFSHDDYMKILNFWKEDNPEGLQRKFYHIAAVELAWRGGEASNCLISHFKKEKYNDGSFTGRHYSFCCYLFF
jgi:hypothetical protein